MDLIDAPIQPQEQHDESAAQDAENAVYETQYGRQDELPLVVDICGEKLVRRRQPRIQQLLERTALQSTRSPPLILRRHLLGQLLNITDRRPTNQQEEEAETTQGHQEE